MHPPNQRLRMLLAGFTVACVGVFARLVALEVSGGDDIRTEATRPLLHSRVLPAVRGRILARDGTVLVEDRPLAAVAIQYRYLEEPPDPHWLRAAARSRLSRRDRRLAARVGDEENRVREELAAMHRRLAELCGLSIEGWRSRCGKIQARVQATAARVNERHESGRPENADSSDDSWLASAGRTLFKALFQANEDPPGVITVAEELQEHIVCEGLSLEAIAEIEEHPELFRGVSVVRSSRRIYDQGSLAAHLIGYVPSTKSTVDRRGQTGIEKQYDALLRGKDGLAVDRLDRQGRVLTTIERVPIAGRDLMLTVDANLQRSAESLLEAALARRIGGAADRRQRESGGAVVAMDIRSGAVLAAASAPRFEPRVFAESDSAVIERYLHDPAHPLFDRTIQMAIPPGSVFKVVTAAALMHQRGFDPQRPFECQGYLNSPESRRCMTYRRFGVGHGPVTLTDALAQSCNVYFFHHAEQLGLAPIVDWGSRFGFGERAGIDLPSEAAGHLVNANLSASDHASQQREEAESLAVGQGSLTATPVQVVRMMAAIANRGQLVTPHVAARVALTSSTTDEPSTGAELPDLDIPAPQSVAGLDPKTLDVIRDGLRQVVSDPKGTGHATVSLEGLDIAGKTGTAETGDGSPDHAWFAGYAPADAPRVAFVIVLEHAGDAAATAGPVAKRLVEQLRDLGYFRRS
jgi:penicillin-binding protein 2